MATATDTSTTYEVTVRPRFGGPAGRVTIEVDIRLKKSSLQESRYSLYRRDTGEYLNAWVVRSGSKWHGYVARKDEYQGVEKTVSASRKWAIDDVLSYVADDSIFEGPLFDLIENAVEAAGGNRFNFS